MDDYLELMDEAFEAVINSYTQRLVTIRTGRATPQLLENIQVEVSAYGSRMPLNQLATINAPDARLLTLNPWDKTTIPDIERAILHSQLGLNPSNDGQKIMVPIPALTGERRQELVRQVYQYAEEFRVSSRKVRREYNDIFKSAESDKEISEDDLRHYQSKVQVSTDNCISTIDNLAKAKEAEVREV
jgi:ribosome recycling factor